MKICDNKKCGNWMFGWQYDSHCLIGENIDKCKDAIIIEKNSSSSPSSIERLEITQERANEILSFFNNQKELEPEFADALQKLVESKVDYPQMLLDHQKLLLVLLQQEDHLRWVQQHRLKGLF